MSGPNTQLVHRFYDVVTGAAPLEALDDLCSPNLRGHAGAGADLSELKQSIQVFRDALPDLDVRLEHVFEDGPLVGTWLTYTGTHNGDFAGIAGSGARVRVAGWDLFEVDGGRIIQITMYCDLFSLMNQIGALPTTATT